MFSNPVLCVKDTIDSDRIVSMSLDNTLNCWDGNSFAFQNSIKVFFIKKKYVQI